MNIQIEKTDAARLAALEKEIRKTEFNLVSMNKERGDILNKYFETKGLLPMDGDFQVSSLPDWSEIIVIKK